MKRKLVFATNNAHKLEEVSSILADKVELLSLDDINCHTDIPETADTLEGNACLQSSFIYQNYGLDCFGDDTGLEVEALGGAPGVYSARFAGGEGNEICWCMGEKTFAVFEGVSPECIFGSAYERQAEQLSG